MTPPPKVIEAVITLDGRRFDITDERCAQCQTPLVDEDGSFTIPFWDTLFEKLFCKRICLMRYRALHLS